MNSMAKVDPRTESLTGLQKTSIVMLALGKDVAAELFKNLKEKDVERLAVEISNMKNVPTDVVEGVVEEFYQMIMAQQYIAQGGMDYAKSVLETALGSEKSAEIVARVEASTELSGFNMVKNADPNQILNFIQNEHPQTIAVILANLESEQTASILAELSTEVRSDVAFRIATMGKISPEILRDVESLIERNVDSVLGKGLSNTGGAKTVADILNMTNRTTEKAILEDLDLKNPELAMEIKNLMFTFDDIERLDDRGIQKVLREVDSRILTLSLKIASEELKDKIFNNLSDRATALIRDELEYMGPVRLKEIEDAQSKVVELVRVLEDQGDVLIPAKNEFEEIIH